MSFLMSFHSHNIIPIKQPVDLLTRKANHYFIAARPAKFFLSQGFIIKHKSRLLPKQTCDFITLSIGESIKTTIKRIMPQFTFYNSGKAGTLLAKIHRVSVEKKRPGTVTDALLVVVLGLANPPLPLPYKPYKGGGPVRPRLCPKLA